MCKKLIFLVSLVFVLGSAWTGPAEAADPGLVGSWWNDPNLVGWWKFDEGSGTIAADSSGRDMHGVLGDNPVWRQDGVHKGCLFFDGDLAHVRIAHHDSFNPGSGSFSVTFWGYVEVTPGTNGSTVWDLAVNKRDSGSVGYYIGAERNQGSATQTGYRFMLGDTSANRTDTAFIAVPLAEWVFVAAVLDRDLNVQKISVDGGQTWATTTPPPGPIAPTEDLGIAWDIGINNYWFHGRIDDVAIFSRALADEEFAQVMMGIPPGVAKEPSPANEATDVRREVVLSWAPGDFAAAINGHTVYLSESFNDVNDCIGGIAHSDTSHAPQRLDFGKTYYWRVDEVNAPPTSTVYAGVVWSFTTEPVGYPIDGANITATASSTYLADAGPENTINGLGLDVNDMHSTLDTDMWLSDVEVDPNKAWIEYEFDKVHKLHEMWVWNSNQPVESMIGFGFRDVKIEYSTNGTDYTTLGTTHEFAWAPGAAGYAHDTIIDFSGATAKYVRLTANSNWGGFMKQYGLSEVRFFSIPAFAREPSPDSGTTDVDVDVTLSFRAGREAAEHNVYLSTDEQAVIDSNVPVSTVTETSHGPLSLDLDTTYYWKVNEVNEAETTTTWQGDIWNFTTHEFFVVDDFEDYNDWTPDEIWATWLDGYGIPANGSTVGLPNPVWGAGEHYAETTRVHGGSQSMPFFYDNTGTAAYSEGERTFAVPQDWAAAGVQTLALHFRGTGGNTGQLYVEVNGSKVVYDGDAADIQRPGWQAWNIEVASFGTDLQSVTTLAIGIDGSGAGGTLYFDDIRRYARSPEFITPVEPSSAGLIGHWKFDGDTLDSSGLGNDGTANGGPTYAVGQAGQAISLDGLDDYVTIDGVTDDITNEDITLAGWVKTDDTGSIYWFSCNGPSGANVNVALFSIVGGQVAMYDINANEGGSNTLVNDLDWHHLAYSRSGSTGSVYVDGNLENTHTADYTFTDPLNRWSIGQEWDNTVPGNFLTGMVDDARIYDYALSLVEIAWLTGRTEPFDKPF